MKRPLIPDGVISRAVREGLELRAKLLADGTSQEVADAIVGAGLKGAWEQSIQVKREPWRYYCDKCKDSGMIVVKPSEQEYARLVRMYGAEHSAEHQDYMQPCEPCRWREREREKRRRSNEANQR